MLTSLESNSPEHGQSSAQLETLNLALPQCSKCDRVAVVQDSNGITYCAEHAPSRLWDDTNGRAEPAF